jgi:hypothetical protein
VTRHLGYFLPLFAVARLLADTITFTNGQSLNGKLSYTEPNFEIVARYKGVESKPEVIRRDRVRMIEFNDVDDNPGKPPWLDQLEKPSINKLEKPDSADGTFENGKDTLSLTGNQEKTGRLKSIDSNKKQVTLKGQDPIPRDQVISILLRE